MKTEEKDLACLFIPVYFHVLQAVSWDSSYVHYGQVVQQLCPGHPVWLMELQATKEGAGGKNLKQDSRKKWGLQVQENK